MEQDNRIDKLIAKLKAGTLTDEELAILTDWYNSFDDTLLTLSATHGDSAEELKTRMHRRLMEKITPTDKVNRRLSTRWLPYAAAVLLVMTGIWYLVDITRDTPAATQFIQGNMAPGGNSAKLTLADGRTVSLSGAQAGIIIGDEVTYFDGSAVISEQVNGHSLMLSTPRGGTYQITLPDGTRVWLNSESTLKYPSQFAGAQRIVELTGEAYFAVTKVASIPFIVISDGHEIEVLGTEFNVSAYADDREIKTTLVSGGVKIASSHKSIRLHPGEQSSSNGESIRVTAVDTSQYTAWKRGIFHFESTPLEDMLKQIARWYDVKIIYNRGIPEETFTGKFRRDVSLKGVVDILRLSMIDVKLEDTALVVN